MIAVVDCDASTGEYFVDLVTKTLETVRIDLAPCVGNSTDGAANMQGTYKGFTTLLDGVSRGQVHV